MKVAPSPDGARPIGRKAKRAADLGLGIAGASFFLGDAIITPAISVMSAVEGLNSSRPRSRSLCSPYRCAC